MGLDMLLYKTKRIKNITPKCLYFIDKYFDYLERSEEYIEYTMKEYCGIDGSKVDRYLAKDYRNEYIERFGLCDEKKKYSQKTIFENIGYWRKADQIHGWFVENIQDGQDDCEMYEVTKDQLEELLKLCQSVIDDKKLASELLPIARSIFSCMRQQFDEGYFYNIKKSIKILKEVLETTDFENEIVIYASSW